MSFFFLFKQKTAYEMRISDWSSDVCSSDLFELVLPEGGTDLVTNTACATADIPADSQVAPTINCDPASFEVEGDPTHVKELVRSEERSVGKECVSTGQSRWTP